MNDRINLRLAPDELELIYDALRFARDEFADEGGASWSDEEYATLQRVIERLETLMPAAEPRQDARP